MTFNVSNQLFIHNYFHTLTVGVDDKFQKLKDHYDITSTETSKDINSSLLDDDVAKDTHRSPNQSETTILPDDYATGKHYFLFSS